MAISVGDVAPDFTLDGTMDANITLSSFRGNQSVVLVFYPVDDTSGWTRQLSALRDDKAKFDAKDTAIFGVNPGSMDSHKKFSDKYSFNFPLLVDADRTVASQYGALKENGKSVQRTVFVVDKEGNVAYAEQGLPPDEELLGAIQS